MQNERPFVLYSTDNYFMLKSKKPTFTQPSYLKINRLTSKLTIMNQDRFTNQVKAIEKKTRDQLFLVMGILVVNKQPYLCVVPDAEPVATLNNQKVMCIKDVNFIPFKHKYLYYSVNQVENDKILKQMGENIVSNNFYFCYQIDLTLTYQKRLQNRSTERKYLWNQNMLLMFTHYRLPSCWRIPIIQGHVKELYCENNYFSFYYCAISRRSKYMSGTRFNSRGIDQNFNASNFVETQEIFVCHNYLFSHVSIRGSAPIFWTQQQFGAPIKFNHTDQQNMNVLQKHFQFLKRQYQCNIVTINLLSKQKSPEKDLKNRFQFYLYKTMPNEPYIYYDLNQQIKEKDDSSKIIDVFINSYIDVIAPSQNFLCIDRYTNKVFRQQTVASRINCLDCIDRTNVIMSRISLLYLAQIQRFINSHTNMAEKQIQLGKQYIDAVIQLWAVLGDRISMIYCGTESVATHLTKQENNSFFSFFTSSFRSINRYYNANVNDGSKQLCIDFFLGNKQQYSKTQYFDDNITKGVIEQVKYCYFQQIVMYALTWNCNMVDPQKLTQRDKQKLFGFPVDKTDIVVVCLQQMVELNSYNVLIGNNSTIVSEWQKVIEEYLNQIGSQKQKSFQCLSSHHMVGLSTIVFISGQFFNRVYSHEWMQIKTGFKNQLGNKGAILLFLQIDSTYLTITNCHLAAGQTSSAERMQDIEYIHNDALNERDKRRMFDKSQYKFFIGDMNFRLQAKNQSVRQILYSIQKQDAQKKLTREEMQTYLQCLLQKDQYFLNRNYGSLSQYMEATIYFLPTYKYVKKEKIYDTKRTPSWCDRMLFYSHQPKKMAVLKYWDVDCFQSDHKPVCGAFKFLLKKEDPDKKKKLLQIYMQEVE